MPRIGKTGALKLSLAAIVSVILVEGLGGILTGSLALLSDSLHATFDATSTVILLVATNLSMKPADEDHTYGHGKIESLGALIGGIILLVLAFMIGILAVLRLGEGSASTVDPSFVGYAAAGYTIGVDFFRMGILTLALRTGSLSIRADLYHALSDFLSTALVFVALGLTSLGYPVGDSVVSIVLASLLGFLSFKLIYASSLDLSDAVSGKLVQPILREIRNTDEVLKCKELRVRRVGQVTYVDAVIAVSPYAKVSEADTIASRVEANLTKLLGKSSIMVHLEPFEWEVPVEAKIRDATAHVNGAYGVHNLSVAEICGEFYVALHVQVDPNLALDEAHDIAKSVEEKIEASVLKVRQVTVHLEPSRPENIQGAIVDDRYASNKIRSIVDTDAAVEKVDSLLVYSTSDGLRINVHCVFKGNKSITAIHDIVSRIEESIRKEFSSAIVTIHAEPSKRSHGNAASQSDLDIKYAFEPSK